MIFFFINIITKIFTFTNRTKLDNTPSFKHYFILSLNIHTLIRKLTLNGFDLEQDYKEG